MKNLFHSWRSETFNVVFARIDVPERIRWPFRAKESSESAIDVIRYICNIRNRISSVPRGSIHLFMSFFFVPRPTKLRTSKRERLIIPIARFTCLESLLILYELTTKYWALQPTAHQEFRLLIWICFFQMYFVKLARYNCVRFNRKWIALVRCKNQVNIATNHLKWKLKQV